jgi:hypothetical protein
MRFCLGRPSRPIKVKTAKTLGLDVACQLQQLADEADRITDTVCCTAYVGSWHFATEGDSLGFASAFWGAADIEPLARRGCLG